MYSYIHNLRKYPFENDSPGDGCYVAFTASVNFYMQSRTFGGEKSNGCREHKVDLCISKLENKCLFCTNIGFTRLFLHIVGVDKDCESCTYMRGCQMRYYPFHSHWRIMLLPNFLKKTINLN